ncbi:MAG: caspase domain-containing protein [Rhizobiaceae bacterium]|nr:caspase domain-containing protein [Rhizobiaceae bacterium]
MPRFLLVLMMACLAAFPAFAERRVALVMAADAYRTLRPLRNALNDGRAVEAALRGLGFEVISETDRDLRRMRRAMEDFREDAKDADVVLVYFAGHGVEISGDNRLLPVDGDASTLDALKASSLPLEEIRNAVASAGRIGLVLLDACRNDPFGTAAEDGRGAVALSADVSDAVRPGLGRVGRAENMLFAFAAAPGETASDGDDGHSPFAAALGKYLATDGLEIRSVLTLVQQEVYERSGGRQLPYVESGLPQLFFASKTRADLPERERLLLAMADVTPDLRAEVEQIANDADMPLAPLYGALIGSDAGALDEAERSARLREAAAAFVKVRDELRTLGAADPEVAALRDEAGKFLADGAFEAARERLAAAADIDSRSRETLKVNVKERTLSEAATRVLSGGAARAELKYREAIADLERALALFDEAGGVALGREQAERRLSVLQNLGDLYTTVGDVTAAGRSFGSFVDGLKQLPGFAAGDPVVLHDTAVGYTRLGDTELLAGTLDKAFASYVAAREILLELTRSDRNPEWLDSLARLYDKVSELRIAAGELDGAIEATMDALEIKFGLAEQSPGDDARQRSLTITHDALGDLARQVGDLAMARQSYEKSRDAREGIVARHPSDPEALRDLSISHDKMGDLMREEGDLAGALASYRASLAIVEDLAQRDPNDSNKLRDLALTRAKIGNVERDGGEIQAALVSYRTSLEIVEQLARGDPNNLLWQRDLSISIEKVADIHRRLGDEREALEQYQRSLKITAWLARADPANAEWLRDVSITLAEIGNLKLRAKDYEGARDALASSRNIRQQLAATQPGNMVWQRDLMLAHNDFAYVSDDPKRDLREAIAIAERLAAKGLLSSGDRKLADQMRRQLAKLK